MDSYKFTHDWFNWAPKVWEQIKPHMKERKSFLEIGSYEGMSAAWTIANLMEDGGKIICVDTWEGGAEHLNGEMIGAEERFDHNKQVVRNAYPNRFITKWKAKSVDALAAMINEHHQFDFIYIDGSHLAKDVLTDACMAWPMLKKDGFMVFDDYLWRPENMTTIQRPKIAIDTFINLFEDELHIAFSGYQIIVRKT